MRISRGFRGSLEKLSTQVLGDRVFRQKLLQKIAHELPINSSPVFARVIATHNLVRLCAFREGRLGPSAVYTIYHSGSREKALIVLFSSLETFYRAIREETCYWSTITPGVGERNGLVVHDWGGS